MDDIEMIPVDDSSAITAVGYDEETETMAVTWINGLTYRGSGVCPADWAKIERSLNEKYVSTGKLVNELKMSVDFELE